MTGKSGVRWTLKELTQCLKERQLNRFDANLGVSGARGDGKSTFLFKIFNAFKKDGFRPFKHQVYSQNDVVRLLANQKFGYCWDDEAINSGYKRDFQKTGQIELIKVVTNYRDNFNIYGSALPFFYSLDKALRELIFMHVHIIKRGLGVIMLPLRGQIHSQDPWDAQTNKKVEAKENARLERNPEAKFRFHRYTTFAGYVHFGPMTQAQQKKYDKLKEQKRSKVYKDIEEEKEKTFMQKIYGFLLSKELTQEGLLQACRMEGKKYSTVNAQLNQMLRNDGKKERLSDLLAEPFRRGKLENSNPQISNLVPDIPS